MNAFKLWITAPVRGWRKFLRALEVTTRASCDAEMFVSMMEHDWTHGGSRLVGYDPGSQDASVLSQGPAELADGSFLVLVGKNGEPGQLPPDVPLDPMAGGTGREGRRAAAFRRYWVARVHEVYPRVVGSWEESSLACTRVFLCKAMREARQYYVEEAEADGSTKMKLKFKRGMCGYQIEACVDWLVTAAHLGTPNQAAQAAVRASLKPNWLMRMCGLHRHPATW